MHTHTYTHTHTHTHTVDLFLLLFLSIYLFLTAIELTPGGSITVHIYNHTVHIYKHTVHIYKHTVHRIHRTEQLQHQFNIILPPASVNNEWYLLPARLRTSILHGFLPPPYVLLPPRFNHSNNILWRVQIYEPHLVTCYTLPVIFFPRSKHSPILTILKHPRTVFVP
jgi:hypothetical protein